MSARSPLLRSSAAVALAALGMLLSGCDPSRLAYHELLFVYTTLNPEDPTQTVVVDRSYPVEESVPPGGQALTGADVRLRLAGGRDSFRLNDSARPGFYRLTGEHRVLPCSTYVLSVTYDTFAGQARITVPDTFSVIRPAPGEVISDSSITHFIWRRSNAAAGYQLIIRNTDTLADTLGGFRLPLVLSDTFIDLRPFYQGYFDASGEYLIKFYALDTHLFRQQGPTGGDTLGPGVLGNVGALTTRVVPVRYVRSRPGTP